MSRLPDENTVKDLCDLLDLYNTRNDEVSNLSIEVTLKTTQLKEAKESLEALRESIIKNLEETDCRSSGNFGWEGRMLYTLASLRRQMKADT